MTIKRRLRDDSGQNKTSTSNELQSQGGFHRQHQSVGQGLNNTQPFLISIALSRCERPSCKRWGGDSGDV